MSGAATKMPRQKRNDTAVKIESDIVRKAKTMCAHNEITVAEYLSGLLRGPVARDFEKFRKEIAGEGRKE